MWNAASSLRHRHNPLTPASNVCEAAPRPLLTVPNRFSGIRDFPYLKLGIRDFKAKSRRDSAMKLGAGGGMPKITLGITGCEEFRVKITGLKNTIGDPPSSGPTSTDSTNYRKLVSNFLSIWLANRQRLFLKGQSWCVFKSWYTGGDPEQRFRCCFADGLKQSKFSFVRGAGYEISRTRISRFTGTQCCCAG